MLYPYYTILWGGFAGTLPLYVWFIQYQTLRYRVELTSFYS